MTGWTRDPSTLFLYQKLLEAYRLCVRGKPSLKSTDWHWRVEKELSRLAFELNNRRYRPGLSSIFVVKTPKPREVIAANIRDRVVHRLVHEYMSPYWEKRFLPFSFACRKGMGPLAAVKDAEDAIRRHSRATSVPLHALKVDVSRFFPSLCHDVLLAALRKHLENDFFLWLTEVIVRHRPTDAGQYRLGSPRSDWRLIEPEKSLFRVPRSRGLPIGNLTSQFFANVYMHAFDEFLARNRRGRFLYVQRYVDDVLILGEDRQALQEFVPEIETFLWGKLRLRLNPRKTQLRALSHGVDHLGFFIKPSHTTVRRSVCVRAEKRMRSKEMSEEKMLQALQSSLGHATHGRNENWRLHLANRLRKTRPMLSFSLSDKAKRVKNLSHAKPYLSFEASIGAEPTGSVEKDLPANERAF
jgi:RNA-directed DNA polymerase